MKHRGAVVIGLLLVQSVYMIAVGIERWLTYNKARQQSRQYAPKVAMALKNSNIDEAISISEFSRWGETIPWETLTSVTKRVPRVYRTGLGL